MAVLVVPFGLALMVPASKVRHLDLLYEGGTAWRVDETVLFDVGLVKFHTFHEPMHLQYDRRLNMTRTFQTDQKVQVLRPYGEFFRDRTSPGPGAASRHARAAQS